MFFFDKFLKKKDNENVCEVKSISDKVNENYFKCTICNRTLDKKYLHSQQTCVDCFSKNYAPTHSVKTDINTENNVLKPHLHTPTNPNNLSRRNFVLLQSAITKTDMSYLYHTKNITVNEDFYDVSFKGDNPFYITIGQKHYTYELCERLEIIKNYTPAGFIHKVFINNTSFHLYYKAQINKNEIIGFTVSTMTEDAYNNMKNCGTYFYKEELGYFPCLNEFQSLPYLILALERVYGVV